MGTVFVFIAAKTLFLEARELILSLFAFFGLIADLNFFSETPASELFCIYHFFQNLDATTRRAGNFYDLVRFVHRY